MTANLKLVPLGGLGEVGMNCMVLEQDGALLVLDCGVTFPQAPKLGVDVIHADFTYLRQRADRIVGLVLTHAHEDHLGAVPYLLRELSMPIHGPAHALAMLKERLNEHPIEPPELHELTPGREVQVGPFGVEAIGVTHSIPHAMALALRTGAGLVVHSGDFKIDPDPVDASRFDAERLRALGDEGVRLLLSDSTNADVEGSSGGERRVAEALSRRIGQAADRVVICTFASHVERLGMVLRAAASHDRTVVLLGRSMLTHHRIARELGLLSPELPWPVGPEEAASMDRRRVLILATGSQGEPGAALTRLAFGNHPLLRLDPGDEVVMSSRVIPGNERAVYALVDALERSGVRVWHRGQEPDLHVSGHGCRAEQRALLELVRPQAFMPVHGGYRQLRRHADLARESGVGEVLVVENGACVQLDTAGLRVVGEVPHGRVHRSQGREVEAATLKERSSLSHGGQASVALGVDRRLRLIAPPQVRTSGMLADSERDALGLEASRYVQQAVVELQQRTQKMETHLIADQAERALRRFFQKRLGYRPVVQALVLHLS